MKLYLATGNKGKVAELIPLVKEFLPSLLGTAEIEVVARAPKDADETEKTFFGNAKIKALALSKELLDEITSFPFSVLSDDSGLEVESLGGRPGVHSARYAGDHCTAEENVKLLLLEMKNNLHRKCRYVCSLYLQIHLSKEQTKGIWSEGYCEGEIMQDAMGSGGFGYDPVFWSPVLGKRMSEATVEEKNTESHRLRAFQKLNF